MFPDAVPVGLNRAGARPAGGGERAHPHELHGIGLGGEQRISSKDLAEMAEPTPLGGEGRSLHRRPQARPL